jgi:hypothetical protein
LAVHGARAKARSYLSVFLIYLLGARLMHGLVASEIVRKTQLEADQIDGLNTRRQFLKPSV